MQNFIVVSGRVVKTPTFMKKSKKDRVVKWAYYRLAVNQDNRTDYLNCVAFGWQAEFVRKYVKKGTLLLVTGRLRNYEYTDKRGEAIPAVQMIVDAQGLCDKWIEQDEEVLERIYTHAQDFPVVTEEDFEAIEKAELCPAITQAKGGNYD